MSPVGSGLCRPIGHFPCWLRLEGTVSCTSHSRDELRGVSRCSAAQLAICTRCMLSCPMTARSRKRVFVWMSGQLLVDCPLPCVLVRSQCDRPVHLGKGREEASSLLYCWDFEFIFLYSPDFDWSFLWATYCGAMRSAATASSGSVWCCRPRLAAPEAGPAHTPFYDLADATTHLLSSIGENHRICLNEMSNYHAQRGQRQTCLRN